MSLRLPPYPTYKDSGVEWLGQIPEHWNIRRLGASVTGCINGIWGGDPSGKEDIVCVRVADFDRNRFRVALKRPTMRAITSSERGQRLLKRGDLLLEKSGGGELQPVGVVMLYDEDTPAVCSNFVARMPVAIGYNPSYLVYLHSHLYSLRLNVRSIKQTTGIQNLDAYSYLSEYVAFPPRDEQDAIVRFLEHTDRRVNRLIRAKRRLIELLNEQKQAVIHSAVTVGLNPDTPRKPSGSDTPFFNDMPEHWQPHTLKHVASHIVDCLHATPIYNANGEYPAIRTADVIPGKILVGQAKRLTYEHYQKWVSRLEPKSGDIVYTREGERFGIAATVPIGTKLCISQRMMLFRTKAEFDSEFIMWQINSPPVHRQASERLNGSAAPHVNVEQIRNFALIVPPLSEQREISSHIRRETAQITDAIIKAKREIELIREYRTRLIADVVTGKIDVRGVTFPVSETLSELESSVPDDAEDEADADEMDDAEATTDA